MNKIFKKITSAFLSAALISLPGFVPVFAEYAADTCETENEEMNIVFFEADEDFIPEDEGSDAPSDEEMDFAETISDAIENYQNAVLDDDKYTLTVDVSDFNITTDDFYDYYTIISNILLDTPEFFYVNLSSGIGYGYEYTENESVEHIINIWLILKYSPEETETELRNFKLEAERIISDIQEKAETDFDRALLAHDYIVENCEYDNDLKLRGANDVLLRKKAVCQGYSSAYKYLLKNMGINCVNAYDTKEEHEWSLIELDGNWYHVDVTHDDPVPNRLGYVSHEYFLITDEEIKRANNGSGNSSWDKEGIYVCDDKTYSDAVWRNAVTSVIYDDDDRYFAYAYGDKDYHLTAAIYKADEAFENVYPLYTLFDESKPSEELSRDDMWDFIGFYSGLYKIGGALYFNTAKSIFKLELDSGKAKPERIYTPSFEDSEYSQEIYGSCAGTNVIYYTEGIKAPGALSYDNPREYAVGTKGSGDFDVTVSETGDQMLEGTVTPELTEEAKKDDTVIYVGIYENEILKQVVFKTLSEYEADNDFDISTYYDSNNRYTYKIFTWGDDLTPYSYAYDEEIIK